jgi:lysophospholipid hydrolase
MGSIGQTGGDVDTPLCAVLVDGGYIDNTPIEPLRTSGIRDIMVIDVGSLDDTSPRNYGDSVSGWWILLNKWVYSG